MPPQITQLAVTCVLACILIGSVTFAAYTTEPRFNAYYSVQVSVNTTVTSQKDDLARLATMLPGVADVREAQPSTLSTASVEQYSYFTSGTADLDTLNNVFRFNITYLSYKSGDRTITNSKPRATTLLMYDVLPSSCNGDALFGYGMNYTWSSPYCTCNTISPENGGGTAPRFYLPPTATSRGNATITVNGRTIASNLYTLVDTSYTVENGNITTSLPISYAFYITNPPLNFLDRVSYTFKLPSGSSVSVTYNFWNRGVLSYSSAMLPDVSCKSCPNNQVRSVRALPASLYPKSCQATTDCSCMASSALVNSSGVRPFCSVPWAVSSNINVTLADTYAWYIKNLTVDNQATPLLPECATEMTNFICAFYLPPCTRYSTRFRPSIRSFLSCFRDSDIYARGSDSTFLSSMFGEELDSLWQTYYGSQMPKWNDLEEFGIAMQSLERERSEKDMFESDGVYQVEPVTTPPPVAAPIDPIPVSPPIDIPSPLLPIPTGIPSEILPATIPVESSPSNQTDEPSFAPSVIPNEPQSEQPSNVPDSVPIEPITPHTPPVAPPTTPAPHHVPTHPIAPVPLDPVPTAPIIMTNASIHYATSFAVFGSYETATGSTVPYPDIYTLKNWQIALMLFGSIGLLITIVISCVMVNRRVSNHYEKI